MPGTQIAMQAAAYGYEVRRYDPDSSMFGQMQAKVRAAMPMARKGPNFPAEERGAARSSRRKVKGTRDDLHER